LSEDPKVTIVIPALNEELNIERSLDTLEQQISLPHRIVVVNDNSEDRTPDIVQEVSRRHPNIELVTSPRPRGITNALKSGFENVNTPITVVMMADLCDDPATVPKMFEKIEEGFDLICASRYMPGGNRLGGPVLQGFFSRFVCSSLKKMTGIPTHDVSNAFKMYRTEILRTTPIEEAGFASSLEICVKAFLKGYRITEVPTVWKGRTAGKSSFKILKVARNYFRWYLWAVLLRNHRF
jgi:glycosyltransferase involved in cell wall biosynthesis